MFYEMRMPTEISFGCQGGPEFQTRVVTTGSGIEYRTSRWSKIRSSWNVGYGIKNNDEWAIITAFFLVVFGRNYGFRFRDPRDHTATYDLFAHGDGVSLTYDLYKTYNVVDLNSVTRSISRRIAKPCPDKPFLLYKNNTLLTLTTDYTVDFINGRITLVSLPAGGTKAVGTYTLTANPANNDTVTIDSQTYTWKTTLTGAANQIFIGAAATNSLDNLIAAINGTAGAGTLYGTGTVAHLTVDAAAGAGDTMTATAKTAGTEGNSIASTEVGANSSWGSTTLTGGTASDALRWTGEFDLPARFDIDKLDGVMIDYGVNDWPDIPVIELNPDEVTT